jgi:electron transport complex protein RnfC
MPESPAFIPIGVDPLTKLSEQATQRALARTDFDVLTIIRRLRELAIDIDWLTCPKLIDQLLAAARQPMDLLCNALDAEDEAAINAAVLSAFAQDVRTGIALVGRATAASSSQMIADSNGPRPRFSGRGPDAIRIATVDASYPSMHPSILTRMRFGRTLMPGRLPTERGVLMIDAAAAWVIARIAADEGAVAIPLVVRDFRRIAPSFAVASPELKLKELLAALRIELDQRTIVLAGPRLRKARIDLEARIGSISPVIHVCRAERSQPAEPCVRCNWCAEICPTGVLPMLVLEAAQSGDMAGAEDAGLRRCIDCGLCDYVCPSRLPLTTAVAQMRTPAVAVSNG